MKTALILLAIAMTAWAAAPSESVHDGDIIFQRSQTQQSDAIAAATHSEYTHMGIIFVEDGKPFVYEAVQPVRKTPLGEWIARGKEGRYVVKRLRDSAPVNTAALKREVRKMLGRDYDWLFDWSDASIYCSELVWKAYKRGCGLEIGQPKTLGEFDLSQEVVRRTMAERYGQNIPLSMKVISPSDIFECDKLVTIMAK